MSHFASSPFGRRSVHLAYRVHKAVISNSNNWPISCRYTEAYIYITVIPDLSDQSGIPNYIAPPNGESYHGRKNPDRDILSSGEIFNENGCVYFSSVQWKPNDIDMKLFHYVLSTRRLPHVHERYVFFHIIIISYASSGILLCACGLSEDHNEVNYTCYGPFLLFKPALTFATRDPGLYRRRVVNQHEAELWALFPQ